LDGEEIKEWRVRVEKRETPHNQTDDVASRFRMDKLFSI